MSDCSNHKKDIAGISDMKVLAEMIGDLHYRSLTELFGHLADKIDSDGRHDIGSQRFYLGEALVDVSLSLIVCTNKMEIVWQISKPFMDKTTKIKQT